MRLVLRRLVLGLGVLLLIVVVWTAAVLLQVRGDLSGARADLEAAQDADGLAPVLAQVDRAEQRLGDASRSLGMPGPAVAARVPLVGRSVAALRATTDALLAVVTAGGDVLQQVPEDIVRAGKVDLEGLARVSRAAEEGARRTERPVERLDAVELGLVPSIVAEQVREVRARLTGTPDVLAGAARAADGMRVVLGADKDQRILLMLQNNAELRGTGGLVTVFAEAVARDGRLDIAAFRDVEEIADKAGTARRVRAPADYRGLWGPFLADSTLWVNTNMTPDVPTASAVLADVAVASGLPRPDAVVWFDVRAITHLLRATGPVRLPDRSELSAENAVQVLLSEAYSQAGESFAAQAARRAALRQAADAVLGELLDPSSEAPGVSALGSALGASVGGRHLAVWSGEGSVQADLAAGGVAGALTAGDGDLTTFTVQNFGGGDGQGNKLDFYARRQVSVDVVVDRDSAHVEQRVTLRNTAPGQGLPRYVAGGRVPGTSRNYVTLALPRGAQVLAFQRGGQRLSTQVRAQTDHGVLTDGATLAPGAETTWLLRYRLPLPDGTYALRVAPQPLAVDAGLRLEVRAAPGLVLRGDDVAGGRLVVSGPLTGDVETAVQAVRPHVLRRAADKVRRFWNEPVKLP